MGTCRRLDNPSLTADLRRASDCQTRPAEETSARGVKNIAGLTCPAVEVADKDREHNSQHYLAPQEPRLDDVLPTASCSG